MPKTDKELVEERAKEVSGALCKHQRNLLATSLLNVLRKVGMLNSDTEPNGAELVMFAEQFCEAERLDSPELREKAQDIVCGLCDARGACGGNWKNSVSCEYPEEYAKVLALIPDEKEIAEEIIKFIESYLVTTVDPIFGDMHHIDDKEWQSVKYRLLRKYSGKVVD